MAEIQKVGKDKIAALLEGLTAAVAERAVANGYTRIIVAGGETSSAVAKKLAIIALKLGKASRRVCRSWRHCPMKTSVLFSNPATLVRQISLPVHYK